MGSGTNGASSGASLRAASGTARRNGTGLDLDLDPEVAGLDGERFGERCQGPLAGRIGANQWDHHAALDTGDERYAPVTARTHCGKYGLDNPERSEGIQLEESLNLGDGHCLDCRAKRRPRVADQYIHRPALATAESTGA
jgi:hypothetical protein